MSNEEQRNGENYLKNNSNIQLTSPTQESGPVQKIYQSDLVMKKMRKKKDYAYGIVDRIYGDSSDSEEYYSDEEEDEDFKLQPGESDIEWFGKFKNQMDEFAEDSKLEVVDRYLTMGDIVKKMDEPFGQSGIIVDAELLLDLEQPETHQIIRQVHSHYALPEVTMKEDILVLYDNKWIGRTQDLVYNIMIKFTRNKICVLENIDDDDWDFLTETKITARLRETTVIPFNAKTRKKYLKKAKWIKGSYDPKKAKVYKKGKIIDIETKDYTLAQLASITTEIEKDEDGFPKFQKEKVKTVFDKYNHLEYLAGDSVYVKNSILEALPDYSETKQDWEPPMFNEELSRSRTFFHIKATKRTVNVLWQDGTVEKDIPSVKLFKQRHVDDTDYLPYDIVEYKENDTTRKGMIVSINSSERLCEIEWLESGAIQKDFPIYFLKGCDSQNFPAGTPIMRLSGNPAQWAGIVIENRGKNLTIEWIDGNVENVKYTDVFIIEEDEIDDPEEEIYENEELDGEETFQVVLDELVTPEILNEQVNDQSRPVEANDDVKEDSNPPTTIEKEKPKEDIIPKVKKEEANKDAFGNSLFQIVNEISDHHFKSTNGAQGRFLHRMRKEFKILTKSLPPQIYVRWSKSNMQHLRCFMVGQPDTPYLHGFYTFDIELPSDYPNSPPKAHYYSYGERINPNLYENGNICLSLLGTWEGRDACECWNPESSNILQLVISLLGLVLTEKPYFNEAGYDKHRETREGDNNALVYNEQVVAFNMSHLRSTLISPRDHATPILKSLLPKIVDELKHDLQVYEKLVEHSKDFSSSLTIMPKPTKHALTYYPTRGFLISYKTNVTKILKLTSKYE